MQDDSMRKFIDKWPTISHGLLSAQTLIGTSFLPFQTQFSDHNLNDQKERSGLISYNRDFEIQIEQSIESIDPQKTTQTTHKQSVCYVFTIQLHFFHLDGKHDALRTY